MNNQQNILIKNIKIVSPEYTDEPIKSVLISNNTICKIEDEIVCESIENTRIIDGSGLCISPGLVDIHTHFRDPGFEYKEDIVSGSKAAAMGGFTDVFTMPNTNPCCDSVNTLNYILEKSKTADVTIHPIASITKSMAGSELCDFEKLAANGAAGFSDDGKCVEDFNLMESAVKCANAVNLPIISHCEDKAIIGNGIINKGRVSKAFALDGMDRKSEDSITGREILISRNLNLPVHIAHVSTAGAITLLRRAKAMNVPVTCETAPHYFTYTEAKVATKNANFRMNPPLRERKDVFSIRKAIHDGVIDVIATDHAPHSKEEKKDFLTAPNGVIGLETSFAVSYSMLVLKNIISLKSLINMMSVNPAKIMKMKNSVQKCVQIGSSADLVLYDPDEKWLVTENSFASKSRNSPFIGERLQLKVKYTINKGRITYEE